MTGGLTGRGRAVLVWVAALPLHPLRVVEYVAGVGEACAAQELDHVVVAAGEAGDLGADRHPTASRSGWAVDDDGCFAHVLGF